jgi:sulfur-oxidizing protein SoxY
MNRRFFLQAGMSAGPIAIAAKAGLLWPVSVLADDWPADAFFATSLDDALAALLGSESVEESEQVQLEAKAIAEDGSSVPVVVRTDLPGPFTITLFSVENPTPAVGRFELTARLDSQLSTRVKMAKSGDLLAVVTKGGKHYSSRRHVQVAAGGCG